MSPKVPKSCPPSLSRIQASKSRDGREREEFQPRYKSLCIIPSSTCRLDNGFQSHNGTRFVQISTLPPLSEALFYALARRMYPAVAYSYEVYRRLHAPFQALRPRFKQPFFCDGVGFRETFAVRPLRE